MKILKLLLTSFMLISPVFSQTQSQIASENKGVSYQVNPEAPVETKQFGRLIGNWEVEVTPRNRDGSWPEKKIKAKWNWFYILDGHAIQDNWIRIDSTGQQQTVGTNIRIYNPDEKQWHMAWIDKTVRRLAIFTAVEEDGKLIMTGHEAGGRMARNTFYNFSENSFDWVKEWTNDDGKTWFEVSKIHCTR